METLNSTLMVNGQGIVLYPADACIFLGHLNAGEAIADYTHIADRIILLSFMADLRENGYASPISIRLNHPDRISFMHVRLSCEQAVSDQFSLSFSTDLRAFDTDNIATVSPLARAAHEMRTPLNAILGFADLLDFVGTDSEKAEKRKEYISMIRRAGQHLLGIVDKTLVQTREAHDTVMTDCAVLADIALETIALTQPLHGNRVVEMIPSDGNYMCRIDVLSLRQIFFNLLSNAIKYTDSDGRITVECSRNIHGYCQLIIEDNGLGMDEQHMSKLGIPFQRAADVSMLNIEGMGLGLALVFDLVKQAGGDISFSSQKGKGTRVVVLLPEVQATSIKHQQNQNVRISNGREFQPETQHRNNGKKTKDQQDQKRKTA